MRTDKNAVAADHFEEPWLKLANECLEGQITSEEYWKRWEELKEQSRQQLIRDNFEGVILNKEVFDRDAAIIKEAEEFETKVLH